MGVFPEFSYQPLAVEERSAAIVNQLHDRKVAQAALVEREGPEARQPPIFERH